jgi:hypothetical protein
MRKIYLPLVIFIFFTSSVLHSQFIGWTGIYNGTGNGTDVSTCLVMHNLKHSSIVSGYTFNGSNYDIRTIHYTFLGNSSWSMTTDRGGDDAVFDIAFSSDSTFIYASGYSVGAGTGKDIAVIKYRTSNGSISWARYYNRNGSGDDEAVSIAVDRKNNVFITGYSAETGGSGHDFTTLKYDSAGNLIWAKHYDGFLNGSDRAAKIKLDTNAKVYVTGTVDNGGLKDYATIKYDSSGNFNWAKLYNGGSNGNDYSVGLGISKSAIDIYVTGYSDTTGGSDFVTIKYDSSGQVIWRDKHNGSGNGNDYASQIEVDFSGNIIVAGTTYGGDTNKQEYTTIKYFPGGTRDWTNVLNSSFNDNDSITAMHINHINCIYITGTSKGNVNRDFYTVLYNTAGWTHWENRVVSFGNGDDVPYAIKSAGSDATITGSRDLNPSLDYYTFMYGGIIDNIGVISYEAPGSFSLHQNYPNPFNPSTKIRFAVQKFSPVNISVYDVMGREVENLLQRELTPGTYEIEWSASKFTSGIYFYRFTASDFTEIKKMILLK